MNKVYFIGAGPGDAELITVKGARLLREAQLVLYAGSLVDRALVLTYAPGAEIIEGTLSDIAHLVHSAGINRQALIIVGDVLAARKEGLSAKSFLYDANFSHGYRQP